MSARQEFKQDYRSIACEGRACAIKYLALAALDISFDETDIREAEIVQRSHLYFVSLVGTKLGVRSL